MERFGKFPRQKLNGSQFAVSVLLFTWINRGVWWCSSDLKPVLLSLWLHCVGR